MFSGQGTKVAFDLLGQAATAVAPPRASAPAVPEPKLDIGWGTFHQGIWSSVRALLSRSGVPRRFTLEGFFKECWVERRMPKRAIAAAALWHIFFLIAPYPQLPAARRHYAAFENTELTWSGPINDLPLLDRKTPKAKPSPRGDPEKPLPPRGADAFHPRQRIFTDPVRPTHPRQTLVNSAAPMEAPKILPNLPNIVQMQGAGPARPRLQISKEELAKLHPKMRRVATATTVAPLPDVAAEQKPGEIAPLDSPNAPARPKLELNAGAAPRLAQKTQAGDAPAPEVGAATSSTEASGATFIAISATPGPPAPVVPAPQGNLAARVSISPEGKQPGVPGGSPKGTPGANGGASGNAGSSGGTGGGNGNGKNGIDVSISGGNPPAGKGVSGLGATGKTGSSRPLTTRAEPHAASDDQPVRTGPPNFGSLPAGVAPEQIFASKKVYKLMVNMPNLNSATGSWILNFSELRVNGEAPRTASTDLSGPAPVRKIDPKYPPALRNEHIEGEVVLYAVIRRDGGVDSIQLVHGIDEVLDANAMEALSQWKFRPAMRQGEPIELEAIVHIPFHAPSDR